MKISDYPPMNLPGSHFTAEPMNVIKEDDRTQKTVTPRSTPLNSTISYGDITSLYYEKPVFDLSPFLTTLRIGNRPVVLTNLIEEIAIRLHVHIQQQKSFLILGYTIRHLSEETGVQLYLLSAYINQMAKCRFTDYLNKFRISYCLELIKNGQAEQFTLAALAAQCGFSNRNTFTSAFKKFVGKPPSSFIKKTEKYI